MSTIQTSLSIVHLESGLNVGSGVQRTSNEEAFTSNAIEVLGVDEVVTLGDVVTPKVVVVKFLSGDPLLIGTVFDSIGSGIYPFRLVDEGESMTLRLETEGIVETSTIICQADSGGSLSGKYFDMEDVTGLVRVWFDSGAGAGVAEETSITTVADSGDSLDGKYFLIYDDVGSVEVWINTSGGSATAPGVGARAIEVAITTGDADTVVATAVQTAVNADSKFSATVLGSVVTIVDASVGTRVDAADVDSGFTVLVTVPGVNASLEPTVTPPERALPVVFTEGATADALATLLAAALTADASYTATATTDTVTVVDNHTGVRVEAVDVDTGWTISGDGLGKASPVVHLKSEGTSQVVVVVAPN